MTKIIFYGLCIEKKGKQKRKKEHDSSSPNTLNICFILPKLIVLLFMEAFIPGKIQRLSRRSLGLPESNEIS
jgi:hypothetical protein